MEIYNYRGFNIRVTEATRRYNDKTTNKRGAVVSTVGKNDIITRYPFTAGDEAAKAVAIQKARNWIDDENEKGRTATLKNADGYLQGLGYRPGDRGTVVEVKRQVVRNKPDRLKYMVRMEKGAVFYLTPDEIKVTP